MGDKDKFELQALSVGLIVVVCVIFVIFIAGLFQESPEMKKDGAPVAVTPYVDPTHPDPVTPDPVIPDPVIPDPVTPDPVIPDPVIPDPVIPDQVIPDPVIPDPVIPDQVIPDPVIPDPVTPETNKTIRVDSTLFTRIFRSSESLYQRENVTGENQVKIRFTIDNDSDVGLKDVYVLLGLDPFLYLRGKYYSLDDGSSVLDGEINSYATTIIRCEFPKKDFKEELGKLSGRFASAEIHYLMQPRTLSYFNYKNRKCLNWARENNNLKNISRTSVTINGRVLRVLERGGDGKIGVYMPYEILLAKNNDRQRIVVDIRQCFGDDPDIKSMFDAGIL